MFTPMAQTVSFAILGALILSFTYIPMMSALCLSKKPITKKNFSDKMMDYLQGIYKPLLEKAIRIKYVVIAVAVGLFTISIFLFSRMGGEFLPKLGEGDFAFHCILPQGTSLSQSLETSMQASKIIKEFDEVKMVVGKTGAAEVPTDPMPPVSIARQKMITMSHHALVRAFRFAMVARWDSLPPFFASSQPIRLAATRTASTPPTSQPVS